MKEPEMTRIAQLICRVLNSKGDTKVIEQVREDVIALTGGFPVP